MRNLKRFGPVALGLALLALVLTPPASAQTYGGTGVLKIKPAARATGMGQSGVALYQRAHSIWWNPDLNDISLPKGKPHGFDVCDRRR